MTSASLALQKAVYAALAADAAVGGLIGDRIYDAAPREAVFPYATIGPTTSADWSSSTEAGAEHRLTLHVWSRERGRSQCLAIVDAISEALDDVALALDGHRLVNLRFESADTRSEPDGITFRATMRFRAVTEPE